MPAFAGLNDMLGTKFLRASELKRQERGTVKQKHMKLPPKPSLYNLIHKAAGADGAAAFGGASFPEQLGMELILAHRHAHSHIWGDAPRLVPSGLTAAVVAKAVHAVVQVLAAADRGCFVFDPANPAPS